MVNPILLMAAIGHAIGGRTEFAQILFDVVMRWAQIP